MHRFESDRAQPVMPVPAPCMAPHGCSRFFGLFIRGVIEMKKCALFFLMAIVVSMGVVSTSGCQGSKVKDVDSVMTDSVTTDTVVADTLERMIEEQPMPKAADELFDDFFFNFAGNRKLQVKRIKFPLPVYRDGKEEKHIAKKDWKVDHFFMRQEYYTLILDNRKQLELVKDTAVSHVVVEKVFFDTETVKQYLFDRVQGLWMLNAIRFEPIGRNYNVSFLEFYDRFSTDSLFQIESMAEEVTFTAPDPDDDFNTITGTIEPEQWPAFRPELIPSGVIYNIRYGKHRGESAGKIFMVRGIANGLEMEMVFRKAGHEWKLVKFDS